MAEFAHAVVLGGSISGLLAAAALARTFEQVTVVDRDELLVDGPEAQQPRRGVPQADQVHHLLSLGSEKIEELLPGFLDELLELGCERYDDGADFTQFVNGSWRMRVQSDLKITAFRRPLFEWAIRRRVLELPNVTAVKGLAAGLIGVDGNRKVVGAKVRGVAGGQLIGDLVVDATGRGSRSPNWLEDLGYAKPTESHLRIHVGYSTFTVRFAEGTLPKGLAGLSVSSTPASPRGAAIRPCGNGQHDVVLYGMVKNYPPDDFDGALRFCDELPSPIVADLIRKATITSEISPYQMAGDQRRWWENLDRRPEGFVVVGDAVTSFNPRYGQGMTMAALGAWILGDVVAGADGIAGLAEKVQTTIAPWADIAFDLAVSLDSAYPQAEYENLQPPSARDQEWSRALAAAQTEEPHALIAVKSTALYMDTSYVAAPDVRRTIAEWMETGRQPRPEVTDPLDPPGVSARPEPHPGSR